MSDGALAIDVLLACACGAATLPARRRAKGKIDPALTGPVAAAGCMLLRLRMVAGVLGGAEGLLPFEPGLPLPLGRMPRITGAPKLTRRVNGVVGAVLAAEAGLSSSSMAFSSMESELVDMLPRRRLKGVVLVGEVPERPSVEIESRRLWASFMLMVAGGNTGVTPVAVELFR